MTKVRKVLVAGGGVGGLCAAIALTSRGVEVDLVEKRPDFNVPGVGLGQPACALRVYREFGILDEILDTGFSYNHMSIFDPQRTLIAEHRFLMGGNGLPAFCALSRSSLHSTLYRRALSLGVEFRFSTEVAEFVGPLGTAVRFNDGSEADYDVVAGFDGIRSTVRQFIVGDMFGPRPSGIGAWRIQVDRPSCVTGMEFLQGIDGKAGAIPIAQDKMYLFNIRPETPGEIFPREKLHVLLKERLAQFGSYVAEIADSLTPESPIVYGALEPFIVPYPWHKGHVVMGGDAAHIVPPHLTAGAAMAAEDGYVLAKLLLSGDGSVDDRLTAYGKVRFARNAFVYTFAREWLSMEQSVHSPADLAAAKDEYARNADGRIAVADRILDAFEC
ncbi:FAD-dependent monooxygenase [Rhizobium puerariae]|uniref:FAD-dependent monooxygenase n=1 Tax=Rhizobium puerariae TaxID=1585791 RepID=A0ABV6AJA7_9HYPH